MQPQLGLTRPPVGYWMLRRRFDDHFAYYLIEKRASGWETFYIHHDGAIQNSETAPGDWPASMDYEWLPVPPDLAAVHSMRLIHTPDDRKYEVWKKYAPQFWEQLLAMDDFRQVT